MSVQSTSRRSGIECAVTGSTFHTAHAREKPLDIISWINSLSAGDGIITFPRLLVAQVGEKFGFRNLIDDRRGARSTRCIQRSENKFRRLRCLHWGGASHDRSNVDLIFDEMGAPACQIIRAGHPIGHAVVQQVPA